MKAKVGIAELKAHLSQYVRAAQKGKEIIIKDRDTPVAKLVPIDDRKLPFRVIPPSRPFRSGEDMVGFRPSGVTPEEIDRIIEENRAERIDEWLSLVKSTSTRR
jgi:prevent-host-death family protein